LSDRFDWTDAAISLAPEMMIPANRHTATDSVLAELFEELAELRRSNRLGAVEEFLTAHSQYADRLRELLPALDALSLCRDQNSVSDAGSSSVGSADSLDSSGSSENRFEKADPSRDPALADAVTDKSDLAGELFRLGWISREQMVEMRRDDTGFAIDQGRYVLLGLVGQGGMGAVFKARHTLMRREVALKVIDPKRVADQSLAQRFRREVEVCSKLQHEHIVQAFDCGFQAGALFLVLEFVEGSDLASLIKRDGPMQPNEAAAICMQAAAGLAYAHSQGIVHRDIKPQNILVSKSGVVKILDMGLARVLDDAEEDPHTSLTQEGAVMGTVDYMAPEQARDTRSADARSDIYSLGATLYYLLAGKPPFGGGSVIEKLHRLATDAPPPLSEFRIDCPRDLDEIVHKMLDKRPEDRLQTAADVVRALRPFGTERIAGRAAVTAAVQSAADTLRPSTTMHTDDGGLLFSHIDESLLSSVRQRETQKASLSRKQTLILGAIVGGLLIAVAVNGWSVTRKPNPSVTKRLGDDEDKSGTAPHAVTNPPGNIRRMLPGHYGDILRLAWSPDGRYLATGGVNGEVRIREPNAPNKPHVIYDKHHAGICNLLWSRDGMLLVSGDYYGKIHVWNAASGKTVADTIREVQPPFHHAPTCAQALAISPNNQEIAFVENGNVVRYNLAEKKRVWGSGGGGLGICYSPSGKLLASSAGPFVWDTATGNAVFGTPTGPTPGVPGKFIIPAFLADDTLALMHDKTIRLVKCGDDTPVVEVPIPKPAFVAQWQPGIPLACFAPDGHRCQLLTVSELIDMRLPEGTTTRHPLNTAFGHQETPEGNKHTELATWDPSFRVNAFAWTWTHGGATICDLDTGGARLIDEPGYVCRTLLPHEVGLIGGRFLRFRSRVWDMTNSEIAAQIPLNSRLIGNNQVRSVQEDRVLTRSLTNGSLNEIPASLQLQGLANEPQVWPLLHLTEDGQTVWGPTADGTGQFAGEIIAKGIRLWDADTGIVRRTIDFATSLHGWPGVSGDGKTLAMNKYTDTTIWVWQTSSDEPALEIQHVTSTDGIHPAISPDGSRIAASHSLGHKDAVVVYRADDGQAIVSFPTGLNSLFDPGVVQFSSSGRYLLVTRKIWDSTITPPKLLWECPEKDHAVGGYNGNFRSGELFPDERHVLIAQDAQLQIWDWRENVKLATLFLLPGDEAVFVNHLTGHFSGSPSAFQYLRTDYDRGDGRAPVEVTIREYEQATGWKNDASKAGIDLEKRNREKATGYAEDGGSRMEDRK